MKLISLLALATALASQAQALDGSADPEIGIFREPGFPARGAASSPEALARILAEAGLTARFVDARELSDPSALRPERIALLVLPYGRSFPATAREAFRAYLKAGGRFLALGGYALLEPLVLEGGRWIPEEGYLAKRIEEALRPERSLLFDGGFEREESADAPVGPPEPDGRWRRNSFAACRTTSADSASGARCAEVSSDASGAGEFSCAIRPEAGRRYLASAWVRTREIRGRGYAYAAVYQFASDGRLLAFRDFAQVRNTAPWTRYQFDFEPAQGAERLVLKAGIYDALGLAWFDDFVLADATGWMPVPMTTATGLPADGLEVRPEQIGLFDADFRLRRVARLVASPGQHIFPAFSLEGAFEGWAASAVSSPGTTRWVSLVDALDRYGRLRGSAGSLVLHHGGYWAGSAWAAFGVESRDLFDGSSPELARGLGRLARFLLRGIWLSKLESAFAAYEPGCEAAVAVSAENRGFEPEAAEIEISLASLDGGSAPQATLDSSSKRRQLILPARSSVRVEEKLLVPSGARGVVPFAARLRVEGEEIDSMESGFVALAPPRESAPLVFRDNYFRFGERAIFLFGSDAYSNVYEAAQGPLAWDRELTAARDFGFQIYENLGYSRPGHVFEEKDWRKFRALALLTQEKGLVFMPGLLIGHNVAISEARLWEESQQCREFARRLKDIPKLIWYVNGDYVLRYEDPVALGEKWARFLEARYGKPPELPFPPPQGAAWDSLAQVDLYRFHLALLRNWNAAHVAAIRAEEGSRPITSEYYQFPFSGIDLRLTVDGLDVSNIGYFDEPGKDIRGLPLRLRWNDLRALGKSVGLGEYGVKTHPAWSISNGASGYHIARTEDEQRKLFVAVAHYAFGLGASRVQNWCLKDSDERVFPWGVFYPGPPVPKDVAYVHRNLSLLFRLFEPRYEAPELTVLLCDHLRIGNFERLGIASADRAFEALLALGADWNVLGDSEASRIPKTTRAIICPAALTVGDRSWEALLAWVEAGGKLLLTGGPIYDEDRRLRSAERIERALGLVFRGLRYSPEERAARNAPGAKPPPGSDFPPIRLDPIARWDSASAEILATLEDGAAVAARKALGRGSMIFVADPLELSGEDGVLEDLKRLYAWFLENSGVPARPAAGASADLHAFSQATRTGRVHVLFSRGEGNPVRDVPLKTSAGELSFGVRDGFPALAAVSEGGSVTALECFREARIGGNPVLEAGALIAAASLDGLDLRDSAAILILPFGQGLAAIRSRRNWAHPRAVLGDFETGRFRALEVLDIAWPSGERRLEVAFDADRATLVALVAEENELSKWTEFLGTLLSEPEKIRGR